MGGGWGFREAGEAQGWCLFPGEEGPPLLRAWGSSPGREGNTLRSAQNSDRNSDTQRAESRHSGGDPGMGTRGRGDSYGSRLSLWIKGLA